MARTPLPAPTPARALASTLSGYRYGRGDPTTRLTEGEFWRATITPEGAGTLHLDWRDGTVRARAWGDGAEWLLRSVPALTGELDPGHQFTDGHPAVLRAQHRHPWVRFGASGTLYHELLPNVIGQRITAGEALQQWRLLVRRLGAPAPGPDPTLQLPPTPAALLDRPAWWYHPLGIEAKRADTLRQVARHAHHLPDWASHPTPGERLRHIPGIGQWTVGCVLATAVGDPDAVAVGDFHLKNIVANALSGRARGTDDEMLRLLQPYAGQRGRAVRLLLLDGHSAPKFGPRVRVLPLKRW